MKKIALVFSLFVSINLFSQVSDGDIQIVQQIFGVEKAALLQEYMGFTTQQDSAFWPVYKAYENERLEYGKSRIKMIKQYLENVENVSEEKASELVKESVKMEIGFKKLQKKYQKKMTKAIGPVKAAQFYQFENYLNNVTNLFIQENIPFVGELQQKNAKK